MALIKKVRGFIPKMGKNVFLAETATLIGDVEMGDGCSIWYGAVLRGDVNSIRLGNNVSVQDNAVIHTLYEKSQAIIGDNCTISHGVCIHGAKISNNVLVGINATVLDNVEIGENTIVAANSLVLTGAKLEPNSIYAGVPAKKIKDIQPEHTDGMINKISRNYKMYASWYKEEDSW